MIEPGLRQLAGNGLGHAEGGAEVGRGEGIEIFCRHIQEMRRVVAAGVVDQDIEGWAVGDHGRHGAGICDVRNEMAGLAALRTDRLGHLLDLGRCSRHQGDIGARLGECRRAGDAQAPPGAGDERTAAIKAGRGQAWERGGGLHGPLDTSLGSELRECGPRTTAAPFGRPPTRKTSVLGKGEIL